MCLQSPSFGLQAPGWQDSCDSLGWELLNPGVHLRPMEICVLALVPQETQVTILDMPVLLLIFSLILFKVVYGLIKKEGNLAICDNTDGP